MKNLTGVFTAAAVALGLSIAFGAECAIPAEKPFGDGYRRLWTDRLNADIDARIEKFRKRDYVFDGFTPGEEVEVEQVTSEFQIGCNMFNFGQLGSTFRPLSVSSGASVMIASGMFLDRLKIGVNVGKLAQLNRLVPRIRPEATELLRDFNC